MANYRVKFTHLAASPIEIDQGDINDTAVDVSLFGRIRLEYGEFLNENLLHLVENFACVENPSVPGTPNLELTHNALLERPTYGQFWYNSTTGVLNFWDGTQWIPISDFDDIAANWGTIYHGEQLPRPVSSATGYEFTYDECIWSVAPAAYDTAFSGMTCATDATATVTMHYKMQNSPTTIESYANYLIIGLRGNNNLGEQVPPPDLPDVTPTNTPSMTPAEGLTPTPTKTPPVTPPVSQIPPTETATPTPVPPLGENTRLYVSPDDCDPGTPGPGGGTNTGHINTDGDIQKTVYDQSTYFSLQNISGGVPPYTVDFQNIYATIQSPTSDPSGLVETGTGGTYYRGVAYPESVVVKSYFGGTGASTNPLRTNVSSGEVPYIRLKFDSAEFNTENDYRITVRHHGRIILMDSEGNSKQWWIPGSDGQDYPEENYEGGCPVGGTNLTNPGNDGPFTGDLAGTIPYYYSSWRHDGIPEPVYGAGSWIKGAWGPDEPNIFNTNALTFGFNDYNHNFGSMYPLTSEYAQLEAFVYLEEDGDNYQNGYSIVYTAINGTTQAELMQKDFSHLFYMGCTTVDGHHFTRTIPLYNPVVTALGSNSVSLWYYQGTHTSAWIDDWARGRSNNVLSTVHWRVDD